MRWIRIYTDQALAEGSKVELSDDAARHLTQVLRLRAGARFSLFNGDGYDYPAQLTQAQKQYCQAELNGSPVARPGPKISITLGQALIKGERMDWAIQKAVELGVSAIVPLVAERCDVRLTPERAEKRLRHWRGVLISACEQCGRADVPSITLPQPWHDWAETVSAKHKLALIPGAENALHELDLDPQSCAAAIGPDGGWSDSEIAGWSVKGFQPVHMGARILRAETVGLAALTVLQTRWKAW